MKNLYKHLILCGLFIFSITIINGQMGNPVNSPEPDSSISELYTGDWEFSAPDAPEGSTEGNITIKSDGVIMTFDDLVAFPSSWVRVRNDSLIYQMDFDLATVRFSLKVIDKDNMTGKAVWKEGQTAVILRKKVAGIKI
jgi:hypothetical protein